MKTFKNSFKIASLLGIVLFGSFAHAQTANSGKWVRIADLATAAPGNISYGSCDYRLTAYNNDYLSNGVMKGQDWVKMDLDGVNYYLTDPRTNSSNYSYRFEASFDKLWSIVNVVGAASTKEIQNFMDSVYKLKQAYPSLACRVNFSYTSSATKSSSAGLECATHNSGTYPDMAYYLPLNKAKLFLERQCN